MVQDVIANLLVCILFCMLISAPRMYIRADELKRAKADKSTPVMKLISKVFCGIITPFRRDNFRFRDAT